MIHILGWGERVKGENNKTNPHARVFFGKYPPYKIYF